MTRSASRFARRLGTLDCFGELKRHELAAIASLVDVIEMAPAHAFGGLPRREIMIIEGGVAVETGSTSAILRRGAVVGPNGATALDRVRLIVIDRRALPALLDLAPHLSRLLHDVQAPVRPRRAPHRSARVGSPSRPHVTESAGP
jgi:hypothetical protein